jgi:hypothetical protein
MKLVTNHPTPPPLTLFFSYKGKFENTTWEEAVYTQEQKNLLALTEII